MKKIILAIAFIVACGVSVMAQHVKKSSDIKQDEVPTAVRVAFENDLGSIPEEGSWTVTFYLLSENGKTIAKPVLYTFTKRKPEKIEVRYTPEGKLESVKGLERKPEGNS